ncbi:unnamed protein product, partial [Amoebophrya sp. A25]|eukprot:GSA25T00024519001.1
MSSCMALSRGAGGTESMPVSRKKRKAPRYYGFSVQHCVPDFGVFWRRFYDDKSNVYTKNTHMNFPSEHHVTCLHKQDISSFLSFC